MNTEFILGYIFPWTASVALAAIIIFTCLLTPIIIRFMRAIPMTAIIILASLVIIGGYIRFFWVPNDHRIYFDEDRYLSYAVSFARFGKAVSIELATPTRSIMGKPDEAARVTVPVLNAWTLRLFGYRETNLYIMAKTVSTATIFLMFGVSYALFGSIFLSLFAAACIALLPSMVFFSPSIGFDSFLLTFSLLSLLTTCLYARKKGIATGILMLSAVILLICVRVEAIAFLPILAVAFFRIRMTARGRLAKSDFLFGALSFGFVLTRIIVSLTLIDKPWCCAEALPLEAFSFAYLLRNSIPNIFVYVTRPEFPAMLTILAIPPLFQPVNWKIKLLILWLTEFFLIYSSYYAGLFFDKVFSGSYGRYFLMQIPPLVMLAGLTLDQFRRKYLQRPWSRRGTYIVGVFLIFISLVPTARMYPKLISYSPYDLLVEAGPRILHQFLDETFIGSTKKTDVIIHNLTAPILLSGRTAVYSGYFYDHKDVQDFVVTALKQGKTVYFDQTHHCDAFPDSCTTLLSRFVFTPVKTKQVYNVFMEMDRVTLK